MRGYRLEVDRVAERIDRAQAGTGRTSEIGRESGEEPLLNVAGPVPWSVKTSIMIPLYTCGRRLVFETRDWLL